MSSDTTRAHPVLPEVDDRLAPPETPYEVHDGELVAVSPADESHATRHSKIQAIVDAHVGLEFDVACDMLTRLTQVDDKAPDVSVFPLERRPDGGRKIEQLAFEVVATQDIRRAGIKAAQLVARGVRRVFAIDVDRESALEWSAALGTWSVLDPAGQIEDPVLDVPLSIDDLVHAAKADDAIARALIAKHNPVIEEIRAKDRTESRAEGEAEGLATGLAKSVLTVLAVRNVAVDDAMRARILGERAPARLERWLSRAAVCATAAELFVDR